MKSEKEVLHLREMVDQLQNQAGTRQIQLQELQEKFAEKHKEAHQARQVAKDLDIEASALKQQLIAAGAL